MAQWLNGVQDASQNLMEKRFGPREFYRKHPTHTPTSGGIKRGFQGIFWMCFPTGSLEISETFILVIRWKYFDCSMIVFFVDRSFRISSDIPRLKKY